MIQLKPQNSSYTTQPPNCASTADIIAQLHLNLRMKNVFRREKMLSVRPHLQQGAVVVEVRQVLEQIPPDRDVIEGHAHSSPRQRMPHVVGIAQEQHTWKGGEW